MPVGEGHFMFMNFIKLSSSRPTKTLIRPISICAGQKAAFGPQIFSTTTASMLTTKLYTPTNAKARPGQPVMAVATALLCIFPSRVQSVLPRRRNAEGDSLVLWLILRVRTPHIAAHSCTTDASIPRATSPTMPVLPVAANNVNELRPQ